MQPNQTERLLVLTLALETALLDEAWEDVQNLLDERDKVLDTLSNADPMRLAQIQQAQERCLALLQTRKRDVVESLQQGVRAKMASAAYAARSGVTHTGADY